jgi:hypothetical protein
VESLDKRTKGVAKTLTSTHNKDVNLLHDFCWVGYWNGDTSEDGMWPVKNRKVGEEIPTRLLSIWNK